MAILMTSRSLVLEEYIHRGSIPFVPVICNWWWLLEQLEFFVARFTFSPLLPSSRSQDHRLRHHRQAVIEATFWFCSSECWLMADWNHLVHHLTLRHSQHPCHLNHRDHRPSTSLSCDCLCHGSLFGQACQTSVVSWRWPVGAELGWVLFRREGHFWTHRRQSHPNRRLWSRRYSFLLIKKAPVGYLYFQP